LDLRNQRFASDPRQDQDELVTPHSGNVIVVPADLP
jgi:hypothetical protein